MKVFLVVPNIPGQYFRPGQPHAGVAYLAGTLIKASHQVQVADLRVEPDENILFKKIINFKPNLLGVTCVSLNYLAVYDLVKRLKKRFKIPIVIGGPHIATLREKVLAECQADMAVVGEGEETLLEIIQNLQNKKKLKDIKGLIWRKGKKIVVNPPRTFIQNLDELPFPAYDLFPLDKYFDKKIPIVSSRGCPGNCTYCLVKVLFGQRFRPRSAESVVEEIEYWHKCGYDFFEFNDDCFSADINRAEKICDLIIKKKLAINWEIRNGIRADRITTSLAKKMRKAGCRFVSFGVESADPYVLKLMKKGIRLPQVKKAFRIMKKAGIKFNAFYMIGTPGDTFKKFLKTYQFAMKSNSDEVRFYNTIPYPGTELFEWIKNNGRFLVPPEQYLNEIERWEANPVFETSNFPVEERKKAFEIAEKLVMKKFFRKYFKFFYFIPYFLWSNKILRRTTMVPGQKIWIILRKNIIGQNFRQLRKFPLINKIEEGLRGLTIINTRITDKTYDGGIWDQGIQFQIDHFFEPRYPLYQKRIKRILEYLKPQKNEKILDVGCGVGTLAFHVAKKGAYGYGLDYSRESIKMAKTIVSRYKLKGKIEYVVGNAMSMPFKNEFFDKIVSCDFIEHLYLDETRKVLMEMVRVLRPGGLLVIYTPNRNPQVFYIIFQKIKKLLIFKNPRTFTLESYAPTHVGLKTPREIETLLNDLGLKFRIVLFARDLGLPFPLSILWNFICERLSITQMLLAERILVIGRKKDK